MERVLNIDGREVGFRTSALTPYIYRNLFGRDLITDLNKLEKAYKKAIRLPEDASEEERLDAQLSEMDLQIFARVAYVMAKQHDKSLTYSIEEWLDGFETFSIYAIAGELLEMWKMDQQTTSVPVKK